MQETTLRGGFIKKDEFLESFSRVAPPDLGGFSEGNAGGQSVRKVEGQMLYRICKVFKPANILETGTHTGCSTNYLLKYAEEEGAMVHSFDVESGAGKDIMDALKGSLVLTKPKKRLLRKVKRTDIDMIRAGVVEVARKGVDLFFHDSDHSYENVKWEYESVTPFMKKGSPVILHDVLHEQHGSRRLFDEVECAWKHIIETPNGLGLIVL